MIKDGMCQITVPHVCIHLRQLSSFWHLMPMTGSKCTPCLTIITQDEKLNILINGTPFCVIMYGSYSLSKMV